MSSGNDPRRDAERVATLVSNVRGIVALIGRSLSDPEMKVPCIEAVDAIKVLLDEAESISDDVVEYVARAQVEGVR